MAIALVPAPVEIVEADSLAIDELVDAATHRLMFVDGLAYAEQLVITLCSRLMHRMAETIVMAVQASIDEELSS